MKYFEAGSSQAETIAEFVRQGFDADKIPNQNTFDSSPRWRRLKELGTELWLDTGDPEEIAKHRTREFSAVTTNNTLLNKEVGKGTYDDVVPEANECLAGLGPLTPEQTRLELAFMLNARHALGLVQRFGTHVSVEEHTDLAHHTAAAVAYAKRYHAICPEWFFVKLPFTPSGVLATRKLEIEDIPVNLTLGFSARQNYLGMRLAQPRFVNVFLGRLNSVVARNKLGDGRCVGERAVLASQQVVRELRKDFGMQTRQIGASLRHAEQVRDLSGLDVLTMPAKVAGAFVDIDPDHNDLQDCTERDYQPGLASTVDAEALKLNTLWELPDAFRQAVDRLAEENLDRYTPDDLIAFMTEQGFPDLFPRWTTKQVRTSREEGKIPEIGNWKQVLESNKAGLDALMNLAALNSFAADQQEMDQHAVSKLPK